MERQQALNRVIELSFKWQQKHEWAAAFKAADRFREYRDKGTEQFDQLSEDRHRLVIAAHSEFIAMGNLLRVHAPQFLQLVPGVDFFTDSAADHSQQIQNVKRLEGDVRAMLTPAPESVTEEPGRKPDADRTQEKKSGKNHRPWDANCARMAKAYIRRCVQDGAEIARAPFIAEELRRNASLYPYAKAAATIDRAFRENEQQWKPALIEAIKKRTQTGRKK